MTVLEHPVLALVRPYLRVGNARQNVSVLQPPDDVRALALAAEVDCCACGAKIRCFRVREKSERARVHGTLEERRLFYAGTCPSEASPGCSRTRAAKDHKAALVRVLGEGAVEREPVAVVEVRDAFGKLLWRHAAVVAERTSVDLRGLEISVVPAREVDLSAKVEGFLCASECGRVWTDVQGAASCCIGGPRTGTLLRLEERG